MCGVDRTFHLHLFGSKRSKLFDFQTDKPRKDKNKLYYLRKTMRDSMKQPADISELHFINNSASTRPFKILRLFNFGI